MDLLLQLLGSVPVWQCAAGGSRAPSSPSAAFLPAAPRIIAAFPGTCRTLPTAKKAVWHKAAALNHECWSAAAEPLGTIPSIGCVWAGGSAASLLCPLLVVHPQLRVRHL